MSVEISKNCIVDRWGATLKVNEYVNSRGEGRVEITTTNFEATDEIVDLKKEDWIEFLKEQLGGTHDENK